MRLSTYENNVKSNSKIIWPVAHHRPMRSARTYELHVITCISVCTVCQRLVSGMLMTHIICMSKGFRGESLILLSCLYAHAHNVCYASYAFHDERAARCCEDTNQCYDGLAWRPTRAEWKTLWRLLDDLPWLYWISTWMWLKTNPNRIYMPFIIFGEWEMIMIKIQTKIFIDQSTIREKNLLILCVRATILLYYYYYYIDNGRDDLRHAQHPRIWLS